MRGFGPLTKWAESVWLLRARCSLVAPSLWQCPRGTPTLIPCSAGTFSIATNLSSQEQCQLCPVGHACLLGASVPEPCAAGRYGATPGQTSRQCTGLCIEGHFCDAGSTSNVSGVCRTRLPVLRTCAHSFWRRCSAKPLLVSSSCSSCKSCLCATAAGRYNPTRGGMNAGACERCDPGRDSFNGSARCIICAEGYYRPHSNSSADACAPCAAIEGVSCSSDTTIKTIKLVHSFWRHSTKTNQTHRCKQSGSWSPCRGGVDAGDASGRIVEHGGGYCDNGTDGGYHGPRCELCIGTSEYSHYFDKLDARCHACGGIASHAAIVLGSVLSVLVTTVGGTIFILRRAKSSRMRYTILKRLRSIERLWREAGMQFKIKGTSERFEPTTHTPQASLPRRCPSCEQANLGAL